MISSRHPRIASYVRWLSLLAVVALLSAATGMASAHEHREVGKYEFTVGFQNEPAYLNQPNGIWVRVVEAVSEGAAEGKPAEGLEETLKAEVIQGNDRMSVPLRAAFGEPGVYLGDFIPTKVGDYIFHFTGTIGGETIDERFESGPNRFNPVEGLTELQFPEKQPAVSEMQAQLEQARTAATQARDAADQARVLGYIGIGVGLLGLLAGLAALAARRGRQHPTPAARTEHV
jgi:hypothetical protein